MDGVDRGEYLGQVNSRSIKRGKREGGGITVFVGCEKREGRRRGSSVLLIEGFFSSM